MTKFFLILGFIVFVVPYLLRALIRFLFGNPVQTNRSQQRRKETSRTQQPPKKKKVIPENEGEYVDYVEMKE